MTHEITKCNLRIIRITSNGISKSCSLRLKYAQHCNVTKSDFEELKKSAYTLIDEINLSIRELESLEKE